MTTTACSLRKEARRFPPGSMDWEYRHRAAWKIDQWHMGIPSQDWTDMPSEGLAAYAATADRIAAE